MQRLEDQRQRALELDVAAEIDRNWLLGVDPFSLQATLIDVHVDLSDLLQVLEDLAEGRLLEFERDGRRQFLLDLEVAGASSLAAVGQEPLAALRERLPFRLTRKANLAAVGDCGLVDLLELPDDHFFLFILGRVVHRLATERLADRDHLDHDGVVGVHVGGPLGDDFGLGIAPLLDELVVFVDHAG